MRKIGIIESEKYVRSLLETRDILFMSSSCFARYYLDNIELETEEHLSRNGWCDISVKIDIFSTFFYKIRSITKNVKYNFYFYKLKIF